MGGRDRRAREERAAQGDECDARGVRVDARRVRRRRRGEERRTETGVMIMKQNIGDADRTIRMLLAAVLGVIFYALPRGTVNTVVGVVTILLLVAALTGWSLLYFVLRLS